MIGAKRELRCSKCLTVGHNARTCRAGVVPVLASEQHATNLPAPEAPSGRVVAEALLKRVEDVRACLRDLERSAPTDRDYLHVQQAGRALKFVETALKEATKWT